MPDKAQSRAQFRFLQAAKAGKVKGLKPKKAAEMLGDQSPKGLPERLTPQGKPKRLTGQARRV